MDPGLTNGAQYERTRDRQPDVVVFSTGTLRGKVLAPTFFNLGTAHLTQH